LGRRWWCPPNRWSLQKVTLFVRAPTVAGSVILFYFPQEIAAGRPTASSVTHVVGGNWMGVVMSGIDALNTALDVIGVVGAVVTLTGGALMLANVDRWPKLTGPPETPVPLKRRMGFLVLVAGFIFIGSLLWRPVGILFSPWAIPLVITQLQIKKSVGRKRSAYP
jgi:hypothetical protein